MSSLEDVSLKSLPVTSATALRAQLRQSPFADGMRNGRQLPTQPGMALSLEIIVLR